MPVLKGNNGFTLKSLQGGEQVDEQLEPLRSLAQAWRVINRDSLNPSTDRSKPINKTNYEEKKQPENPRKKKKEA